MTEMDDFEDDDDVASIDSEESEEEEKKVGQHPGRDSDKKKNKYHKSRKSEKEFISKILINFEDQLIDFFFVKRVKKEERQNFDFENEFSYDIVISNNQEDEIVFSYINETIRDEKFIILEAKLIQAKTLIV